MIPAHKSKLLFALLLPIPGASDVYIGQVKSGLGTFGLFLLSIPLLVAFGLGIPFAIIVWCGNLISGITKLIRSPAS